MFPFHIYQNLWQSTKYTNTFARKTSTFHHVHYLSAWINSNIYFLPSGLGLKNIPTVSLQKDKNSPNEFPGYVTKQSDGKVPWMLELWGMGSAPSLSLLPGSLRPGVVAPDRVLSMGQIELNCVFMQNWIIWNRCVDKNYAYTKLNCWIGTVWLNSIAWNKKVFDNWTVYSW